MSLVNFQRTFSSMEICLGLEDSKHCTLSLLTEHCSLIFLITQSVHIVDSSLGPVSDHSLQFSRRDLPSQDLKINCTYSSEHHSG